MLEIKDTLMISSGKVEKEIDIRLFGKKSPSRGWYIVADHIWHLYHDGKVRRGVNTDGQPPAFWATEKDAQSFFDEWKNKALKT